MTSINTSLARFATALGIATILTAGCAGVGRMAAPPTPPSATLQAVTDDYRQALRQTAAVDQALDTLAASAPEDLRQSLRYFKGNLAMMEQIGERLVTHSDGMFFRGTFYFVESGRSLEACAFPRTGRTDDLRSIDLGEDFVPVSEAGGRIKRSLRAYLFDIKQAYDLLDYNLNPAGQSSAYQIFAKARVDSASLQEALRRALTALEHASRTLPQENQRKG